METWYLAAAYVFALSCLAHTLLMMLVWRKNGKQEVDWVALLVLGASAFGNLSDALGAFVLATPGQPHTPLSHTLARIDLPLHFVLPPAIRHCLVLSLLPLQGWKKWAQVSVNYAAIIPVVFAAWAFSSPAPRPGGSLYGPAIGFLFLVYLTLSFIESRTRLEIQGFYTEKPWVRLLLPFCLAGSVFFIVLSHVLFYYYPDKEDVIFSIPSLGGVLPAFVLAYAVIRYRYIDVLIKRGLLYSMLSGLFLGLYLLGARYGGEWLFPEGGASSVAFNFLMILLLLFAFQPLKGGLQREIDRIFFCSCHSLKSAEVRKNLSQTLTTWTDLERLSASFTEKVTATVKTEYGAVLFGDGAVRGLVPASQPALLRKDETAELCDFLERNDAALVVVEELPHGPLRSACTKAHLGLAVSLPCHERRSWLLLGKKHSRGPFLSEETTQLELLCGELAIALDNFFLIQTKIFLEREMQHKEKLIAIGQLAATVAHDIRNPITGAKCLLQQVGDELSGDSQGKEYIQLALEDLERVEQSVSQLLTFARKEAFSFSEQDVAELVGTTVQRFAAQVQTRDIAISMQASAKAPAAIDEEKMRRVLVNLLTNAADAVNGNGVIAVSISVAGPDVEIRVSDNGHGLALEDQEHIFEPFFTMKEKGTGLGLAIAKKIVDGHGGHIAVESAPGQGTTFIVTLPRQRPETRAAA